MAIGIYTAWECIVTDAIPLPPDLISIVLVALTGEPLQSCRPFSCSDSTFLRLILAAQQGADPAIVRAMATSQQGRRLVWPR